MALLAAVGQSLAADGREAGLQAAQQALDRLGRGRVAFGWVIASSMYPIQQVQTGIFDLLGDVPLIGFSTSAELTVDGRFKRSVVVGLFSGDDVEARAGWWPDFTQDSRTSAQHMLKMLQPNADQAETLLLMADGLNGDAGLVCDALSNSGYAVAGGLAGGEVGRGRTFQVGGRQSGNGGLAAMVLSGNVVVGVGAAHGWHPVGALARLTRVQGQWVRTLDSQQANETYARWFGYPARDWAFPPLNDLVRLYPLAFQDGDQQVVRSPLRVEADGSLRMNTRLPEGKTVDLMIGSAAACAQAARQATQQALVNLGPTTPRAAVLLVDVAWQLMLDNQPQKEIQVVREVLGAEIPVMGGYTFGQLGRLSPKGPVHLMNQHMEVILFGVKSVEVEGSAA